MTTRDPRCTFGFSLCLVLAGCALPASEEPIGAASSAIAAENGVSLNGRSLNGRSLNGRSLNGRSLNGRSLNGVSLGGATLDGTSFEGVSAKGRKLRGKDFVGASFTGELDDGTPLTVHVDAMRRSAEDKEVWLYAVSFQADDGPAPLCEDEDGAPALAIPLAGRWDYREGVAGGGDRLDDAGAFTFACRGHALAKCVELGYAPFRSVKVKGPQGGKTTVPLADHHQACTRLIRADYCGDGASHTVDGTLINLYDAIGIQRDTEGWSFEGEWGPEGARCVTRERVLSMAAPACLPALTMADCGAATHFAAGALLMSEDAVGQGGAP